MQYKASYTEENGRAKHLLFQEAYRRINRSIALGFHLEAITLLESLISDRLETVLSLLGESRVKVSTLGPLIMKLRKINQFDADLLTSIDEWRKKRNLVLHQMVKITDPASVNWRSRVKFAKEVAVEGKKILDNIGKEVRSLKRNKL